MADRLGSGDASALLLAVVALAVPLVNESGRWQLTDTAIGLVVGVIVVAYTLESLSTASPSRRVAIAMTYISAGTVTLAWVAQRLVVDPLWSTDSQADTAADRATLIAGVIAAVAVLFLLRKKLRA
jgi:multisubunit Na+/H+ antiporter MnhE subunit